MTTTNTKIGTIETLETDERVMQRIQHAVTLKSCGNDKTERKRCITYLKKISDDAVLDYVLSIYVEPFSDYIAGIEPRYKPTAIDTNEFFRRVGASVSPLLDWCLDRFHIPDKAEKEEQY